MSSNYIIYILIILILILLFLNPLWIWNFKKYLISTPTELNFIEQENLILKSKLIENQNLSLIQNYKNIKPAFVYSRYPFNLKSEILINLGKKDNIKPNDVVVLPNFEKENKFFIIGKVFEVFENFSVVKTIFDVNIKLAVKIGLNTNALFEGGPAPRLNLIPREAKVVEGDIVYSVDPDLPYGLIIGRLGEIRSQENNLFNSAEVIIPYDLNQLSVVGIVK